MIDLAAAEHAIGTALGELADPARAAREKRYLKSDLTHLGVPVPAIRTITAAAARGLDRDLTLALTAGLWHQPVHELRMAAVEVLIKNVRLLEAGDLGVAERMIRESHTWAYVDVLAVKVAGMLVTSHPSLATSLDRWAHDENFWIRRSALLALLTGIRAGGGRGDLTRLSAYGDALIEEKEFFVRKALGWVLRELSKANPDWVTGWVRARVDRISGVTLREAVRHLPEPVRDELLTTYRSR